MSQCCSSGSHCPATPLFLQEAFRASCSHPHPATERLHSWQIQEGLRVNLANLAIYLSLVLNESLKRFLLFVFQGVFQRVGVSPFIKQLHRGLIFPSPSLLDSTQSHHHTRYVMMWWGENPYTNESTNHTGCLPGESWRISGLFLKSWLLTWHFHLHLKNVPVCLACATLHAKQFQSSHKTWIGVIVLATYHFWKLHQTPTETANLSSSLHQWEIQWVDGGLWSWRPLCTGCRVKML